jgi:hypothetical protein
MILCRYDAVGGGIIISDIIIGSEMNMTEQRYLDELYTKIEEAEESIREGKVMDARESLRAIREKYNI